MTNFKLDPGFWKNGIFAGVIASLIASYVVPYFLTNLNFGRGLLFLIGIIIWIFVMLVARELLSQPRWVTFIFKKVINNYKSNLAEQYGEIGTIFHQNESLSIKDAYIPLKFSSKDSSIDIHETETIFAKPNQKSIILGKAGSGKTVFLQHLLSSYAQGEWDNLSHFPIPIYVELKTLDFSVDKIETSLQEYLYNELIHADTNDEHAKDFLLRILKNGQLILLLNGLDEVKVDPKKVNTLINLLKKDFYKNCRVIFTCRLEAWEQFKKPFFDYQLIEVKSFDDSQIRQFILNSWQMQEKKSVAELMELLNNNPNIKNLAKNPFLLTLLIYDYTHPENINTPFELPNSRVEFYERATEKLFRQEYRAIPQDRHINYHQVLQELAFISQTEHSISLTEQKTEDGIREAYKSYRDSQIPSFKEITLALRESGLLLYEDGKYKFAHSTLREYYVANKFETDKDGKQLLEYFKDDPLNWEEIVKLWCELVEDSTPLIENIYETHKEIAFECLVNSQHVNGKIANDIITIAKDEFQQAVKKEEKAKYQKKTKPVDEKARIVRAFGVVAADQSNYYGIKMFDFLREILIQENQNSLSQQPSTILKNAAYALSMTSQEAAADLLVIYHIKISGNCPYLENMGDITVSSLQKRIKAISREYQDITDTQERNKEELKNLFEALAQLAKDGNNQARELLIDCLWDDGLAKLCIKKFAPLFSDANMIKLMREYPITKCRDVEELNWVWEPFKEQEPEGSSLPKIAGRVAYLLSQIKTGFDREEKLDPLLIIPLCAIHLREQETNLSEYGVSRKVLESLTYPKLTGKNKIEESLQVMKKKENTTSKWETLFATLTPSCQYELLLRLVKGQFPDKNDWNEQIKNTPVDYQLKTGIHYKSIKFIPKMITVVVGLFITYFIFNVPKFDNPFYNIVWYGFWGYASIVIIGGWYWFWKEPLSLINEGKKQAILMSQIFVLYVVKIILLPFAIIRIGATIILRTTIFVLNLFLHETSQIVETTQIVESFMKYFSFEENIINRIPLIGWFLVISISLYIGLSSVMNGEYIVIFLASGWLIFYFTNKWLWEKGLEKEKLAQNPLAGIFQEGSKCQPSKQM